MKGHGTKIIKLVSTSGKNPNENSASTEGRIGKVCYVDDSRTSAYVTKKILKEYGYEVDFFPSAEPAVVAILENDYDLLLTDLTLSTGGMDGDELVRFLRNSGHPRKKLLPVIVITGTSDKETLLKIYEAGANGVLVKPITGEELHDRIRTLVPEKPFPGTPEGYALEIPHSFSEPGKTATDANHVNVNIDSTPTGDEISIELPTGSENEINEEADMLLSSLGINTGSDTIPKHKKNKIQIKGKQKNQQDTSQVSPDSNKVKNKQKDKKLSILENLKLAASESDDDLDFGQNIEDIQEESPANTSRQQTKPTYKSRAHKKSISSESGKQAKPPKSAGAEFIAELRAQAKEDEARIQPKPKAHKPETENLTVDDQFEDDIPILEPAKDDDLMFILENEQDVQGAPELKFNKPSKKSKSSDIPEFTLDEPDTVSHSNKEREQESSPAFNFDTEELVGDKKIITALDINTEFSEFDDDIFEPSMSQSIFDTFRNFKILGLSAVVSVGIIFWSLWSYFNVGETHTVETVKVSKGTLHQTISVPGKIVSKLNINITSSLSGQVVSVLVKEGVKVNKGQILVKLENEEAISDLKRAEGNLLSAKEETALANKTLKRMNRALKLGAISRQQMEETKASLKSAQARENVAEEVRRTAKLGLDKLSVSAPFSGTVTTQFAQVGQWITPSDTLFTLVDLRQREIEVKVDTADSNSITVGQSVFLSSDAFPGNTWTESVRRIATATNKGERTNTVSVFISLGPGAPRLRMGQQVDAEIRTFSRSNTTKLPINAAISRNGKSWVATIKDGRVHYVPIETGMEDLTHIEILRGVKVNQEVIIPNGVDLQEGDRVRISATLPSE